MKRIIAWSAKHPKPNPEVTHKTTRHLLVLSLLLGVAVLLAAMTNGFSQPIITVQPQWQTNIVGGTATFSVGATGTPPLLYQWRRAGNLPDQTNSTFVLTNLQLSQQAQYSVVVSNVEGSVISSNARLYVLPAPAVTPANPAASLFADVTLEGSSAPAGPVSYQWLFNGVPISGAVSNRLTVTNVQKTNAGDYAFVVTYAFGSVTSQVAMLTITPFNSLYCFGHSWTDTHNGVLDPVMYYHNHDCNGLMWPEYLSTNLGFAYDPARNFAVGGAPSGDVLNLQIPQLSNPADARSALFVVWALEGDFAQTEFANPNLDQSVTNDALWNGVIRTMVRNTTNSIVALYAKGARSILVPSMAAYGSTPGINTSNDNTRSKLNQWSAIANAALAAALDNLDRVKPDLRILRLDFYTQFNQLLANSSDYGFTKVLPPALLDPSLLDKSFAGPGANYLWWDGRHGTTKTHGIWASWIYDLVTHSSLERLSLAVTGNMAYLRLSKLNNGREYTVQKSADLSNWADAHSFIADAGTNQWLLPTEQDSASFYRLKWQP